MVASDQEGCRVKCRVKKTGPSLDAIHQYCQQEVLQQRRFFSFYILTFSC